MVANERGLSPLRVAVVLFSIQIIFFLYHVALSNPGYVNPAAVIPWAVKVSGKMGECMEVAAWWLVYGRSPSFKVHSVMIPSVVEVVAERDDIGVAEATDKAEDAQTRSSQSGGDKGPPNREETNIVVAAAPDKAEDAQTRSFQMRSSWASGRRKRSSQSGGDKGPPNREETNIVVAEATSSDGTIVADIVGSHVLLPVNSLLPDVHEIVHPESALQRAVADIVGRHVLLPVNSLLPDVHGIVHPEPALQKAASYTALKAPHLLLNSLLSDEHEIVHPEPGLQAESYTALKAPRVGYKLPHLHTP